MSYSENTVALLQKVPIFNGMTDRQLKLLSRSFKTREYADGEAIVQQGEGGLGIFIIISGRAEAIRQLPNGDEVSVNSFGPNDFFGELALLSEGTRTASVIARSELDCMVLARWDFIPLLREDADMAVAIAQELATRFRNTLDTIL